MFTNKAIEKLSDWAKAAKRGDHLAASQHLRGFYHVGASLVASGEFQELWHARQHAACDAKHLESVCLFLEAVAAIEASQVRRYGQAA